MSLSAALPTVTVPSASQTRAMMLSQPFGALSASRRFCCHSAY
jgi:hypothetical protein